MQLHKITDHEFAKAMNQVLKRVQSGSDAYVLLRQGKPMARLVNEQYMQAIEALIERDPVLAKTFDQCLAKQQNSATAFLKLAGSIPKGGGLPKDLAQNHSEHAWDLTYSDASLWS